MPKIPKLPPAAQAWAELASLTGQSDADPDVATSDYVGPIPMRVLVAVLLDLRARIVTLESKP